MNSLKILLFFLSFCHIIYNYDNAFLINTTKTFYAFPDETGSYSFTGWTKTATLSTTVCNSVTIVGYEILYYNYF